MLNWGRVKASIPLNCYRTLKSSSRSKRVTCFAVALVLNWRYSSSFNPVNWISLLKKDLLVLILRLCLQIMRNFSHLGEELIVRDICEVIYGHIKTSILAFVVFLDLEISLFENFEPRDNLLFRCIWSTVLSDEIDVGLLNLLRICRREKFDAWVQLSLEQQNSSSNKTDNWNCKSSFHNINLSW